MNDDKCGQLTEYGKDKYIELLERQLTEKNAMIDWLSRKLGRSDMCPIEECPAEDKDCGECWKEAAQEAVKKSD